MAQRTLPARRYFGAFLLVVAVLYGLVFLTGDTRTPQLGLDLRGGTTVTLTAATPDGQAPDPTELELARQIIEQRVNGLGVAEAEVVTEGDSNIVISVPGDDGEQARELGQTAQLRFRPVVQGPEPAAPAAEETPAGESAAPADPAAPSDGAVADPSLPEPGAPPVTQEQAAAEYATLTCAPEDTTSEVDLPESFVAACTEDGTAKYLLGPAIIEGTQVADASAGTEPTTGEWVVLLD
ncbi:MAG TPA: protein translocase subunit SecD, partial [Geodermatophilus sp.]|nr:protein translocase subunit SecD [Geodermatophilus sp.]